MKTIRLTGKDTARFLELREKCLIEEAQNFRTSALDNSSLGFDYWHDRIERDHVAAIEIHGDLKAIGGLSRFVGEKLDHKGLIWGMYVHSDLRGTGAADAIMNALVDAARGVLRQLQLTLAADNVGAQRFYERHLFTTYAIEPDALNRADRFADEALMWRLL
jgi:ribosomal protein S18 acetylase RimI-like enzyme